MTTDTQNTLQVLKRDEKKLLNLNRRSWLQTLFDWIYGYDFFISYRWSDGREYALALSEKLKEKDYNCFLDTEDYLPGINWIEGGQRALKRTTRLILVCSNHAVDDPAGRTAKQDPILKELAAFSEGERQKVRIQIHTLSDEAWEHSEVSRYFAKEDLFLPDNLTTPSPETIENLARGCRLEKRDRLRLKIISSVCIVLSLLSFGFGLASWIAVDKRAEAVKKTEEAIHNLGLSHLREAGRLEGEGRNWSAALLIAQTLGLESDYKFHISDTITDGHVNVGSPTGKKSLRALNTLLDHALIPQQDVSFFNLSERSYLLSPYNDGTLVSIGEAQHLQSVSKGGKGQVSILSGEHRVRYLSEQLASDGGILWIDEQHNLYKFNFADHENTLVTSLATHASDIAGVWLNNDSNMAAYLSIESGSDESILLLKNLSSNAVAELSGVWREKSKAVFISDQYFIICGEDPFPEESGVSSTWKVALYDVNLIDPLSVIEFEPQLYIGQTGAVYPEITTIILLDDELLTVAIGGDDGAVRVFTIEESTQPQSGNRAILKLKRTLTQEANSRSAITSLAATEDGVILLAGAQNGEVLNWDVQVGQLINNSQSNNRPIVRVAYNEDNYFTLDSKGKLVRWRDRPFIYRTTLPGESPAEILDIRTTGENGFNVYSDQGKIYRYMLSGSSLVFQNEVANYDVSSLPTDSVLNRDELGTSKQKVFDNFSVPIASITLTSQKDGTIICFSTGNIEMWDLDQTGIPVKKRWTATNPGDARMGARTAISPDGRKAAITGYATDDTDKWGYILSTKDGSELYRFQGDAVSEWGSEYPAVFLEGGKSLVSGLYSYIYLWPTQMPYFRSPSTRD